MGFERVYIIFVCVNAVLMLGGFSVTGNADVIHGVFQVSSQADSTGLQGILYMLKSVGAFFFNLGAGGGVIGLLAAAGTPYELQVIIGAPLMIIGIIGMIALMTSVANLARSLTPGF